jgi:hypothetical protein
VKEWMRMLHPSPFLQQSLPEQANHLLLVAHLEIVFFARVEGVELKERRKEGRWWQRRCQSLAGYKNQQWSSRAY